MLGADTAGAQALAHRHRRRRLPIIRPIQHRAKTFQRGDLGIRIKQGIVGDIVGGTGEAIKRRHMLAQFFAD